MFREIDLRAKPETVSGKLSNSIRLNLMLK